MAKSDKEVVEKAETTALAATGLDFTSDAGAGFSEARADSYAIPFIYILQSGSPQVKKSEGAYIKGAEEGMFYNTVDSSLFSGEEGIVVLPCHFAQRMIEWKPRDSGGGFVAEHSADTPLIRTLVQNEKNRDVLPNGNLLVDTRIHYVLLLPKYPEMTPAIPAVINMSSTQRKKSRKWMSMMQGIQLKDAQGVMRPAPMFSNFYRLKTVAERNDQGAWFGFAIELEAPLEDVTVYNQAKAFLNAVRTGEAKVQHSDPTASGDETF